MELQLTRRWTRPPRPVGAWESQPLPPGQYRLRLRMQDVLFFDEEFDHGGEEAGSLSFRLADVPMPQNPATSTR